MSPYDHPRYYEIAFSFFDVSRQADLIEEFVRKHSRRKVRRILDVCCGPSLQLREFTRRGYEVAGLDRSRPMLRYLKAREPRVETLRGDMRRFRLRRKADLAVIMMGTLSFASEPEYVSHLGSVAASLNRGALYLIENLRFFHPVPGTFSQAWSMRRGGVRIRTRYATRMADAAGQVFEDSLTMLVSDGGRRTLLRDRGLKTAFSAAQFAGMVEGTGAFDLVGWFERDRVAGLKEDKGDNMVVLRRR